MKKAIFILTIITLSWNCGYATYSRTVTNCSWHGCNDVSEERDGANTTISCSNPGWTGCPKLFNGGGNNEDIIANELLTIAISSIQGGNLKGKSIKNGFIVVWSSLDSEMTTSDIKITRL